MNKKIDTPIGIILSKYLKHIRTFCADKKYQKTLRMDAFLTPNEADDFWEIKYIKEKIIFQNKSKSQRMLKYG